jgi:hypothetical protein
VERTNNQGLSPSPEGEGLGRVKIKRIISLSLHPENLIFHGKQYDTGEA